MKESTIMRQAGLDPAILGNCSARLRINNDLQTLGQVLYLVGTELSSHQTRLKGFVQTGQSALRRLADTCAGLKESPPLSVPDTRVISESPPST